MLLRYLKTKKYVKVFVTLACYARIKSFNAKLE